MRDVVRHLIDALEQNRELILCPVVETQASTPPPAGALMALDPEGGQVGTLGGGVENEVKMKAIRQLGGSAAAVHSFVRDHDHAWADGLICGGRMVIVTQSVRGPAPLAYFVLIMTRGHGRDQEALYHLAPTATSYVGLIGSRRKIPLIIENLRVAGISDQHLERVTAPVGLEIGSKSVPEIAISIVAELIARRNLGPRGTTALPDGERFESAITGALAGAGVASPT
jgi:xanthine/CO dehydrogenase XdhC/CoxF family maturation factor